MKIGYLIDEIRTLNEGKLCINFTQDISLLNSLLSLYAEEYPKLIHSLLIESVETECLWNKEKYYIVQRGKCHLILSFDSVIPSMQIYEIIYEDDDKFVMPIYIESSKLLKIIYESGLTLYKLFSSNPEIIQNKYSQYFGNSKALHGSESLNPIWVEAMREGLENMKAKVAEKETPLQLSYYDEAFQSLEIKYSIDNEKTIDTGVAHIYFNEYMEAISSTVQISIEEYPTLLESLLIEPRQTGYYWGQTGFTVFQTGLHHLVSSNDSFATSRLICKISGESYIIPIDTYIEYYALLNIIHNCSLMIYSLFENNFEIIQDKYIKYRESVLRNDTRTEFINKYLSPNWKEAMKNCLKRLEQKIDEIKKNDNP